LIPRATLAPGYSISRLIKGGWHLAGGHGTVDPAQACRDMAAFVEAGITTFDCADIYTGVEELIGRFRREHPQLARELRVHTKFVPDLDQLGGIERGGVEAIVDRSLHRLGVQRLDLVQFHWWDYSVPRYVDVGLELERLQRAGKIEHIGVTNFGVKQLGELLDAGLPVCAHQLQYSLLDARPERAMAELCRARGIALLCYGTVAGGFLSERWVGEPQPQGSFANRSLTKYRLVIDEFGGWPLFQELLDALQEIAVAHDCDIASVAVRAILDRPGVAAAIVGATNASHLASHRRVGDLVLTPTDRERIRMVTDRARGPRGDVYELERDRAGPHGRIMKYTLNRS
jgi:aryl-alcohol dehydrogenase-like predicted oxidoreductase